MGHSHSSSSHKRLRSISSTKNCGGEFTEIVDFEFSDAGTFADAPIIKSAENSDQSTENRTNQTNNNKPVAYNTGSTNTNSTNRMNRVEEEIQADDDESKSAEIIHQYPKDLIELEEHVKEVEQSLETMSPDEFFVYFPTLKDDLHNCWQKVYGVREENVETKLKKHKVIDNIRELLRKLNARLHRREFSR